MTILCGDIIQNICNATTEYVLLISYPKQCWTVLQLINSKYRRINVQTPFTFKDWNKSIVAYVTCNCFKIAPIKCTGNVLGVFNPNSEFISEGLPIENTGGINYTVPDEFLPIPFEGNIIPATTGKFVNGGQIRFVTRSSPEATPSYTYGYITVDNPTNPTVITSLNLTIAGNGSQQLIYADPLEPITLL